MIFVSNHISMELLLNPFTVLVIAFVAILGFIVSPYDLNFEEGEDFE